MNLNDNTIFTELYTSTPFTTSIHLHYNFITYKKKKCEKYISRKDMSLTLFLYEYMASCRVDVPQSSN